MPNLIREIPLQNGLIFKFFDASRRYFGDYHQVRVKILCDVPVTAEQFDTPADFQAAAKLLGARVQYLKEIEHQGVASAAVSETVERVIGHFTETSLAYFDNGTFPKRFVHSELKRLRSRGKGFVPLRANG